MFEVSEKLWNSIKKPVHLAIMLFTVYMLYVHRRVIKAAVLGEETPECPHDHCGKFHNKHTDSESDEA